MFAINVQGSYRSGETGKRQGILVFRERSGVDFFGKVTENEKLVPPDVRFSAKMHQI